MKLSYLSKIPCKSCGKTGAYIEYKKSDVTISEDVGLEEIMRRNYYKCKYCGFEDINAVESRNYIYDNNPGLSIFVYNIDYKEFSN